MIATIYIWFVIVLYVLSGIGRVFLFFKTDKVTPYDLAESALALINCAGLIGYLYNIKMLNQTFWFVIIGLGLASGLRAIFLNPKNPELIASIGPVKGWAVIIGSIAIVAPHMWFLYKYAKSL